jgi:hypothetical protein
MMRGIVGRYVPEPLPTRIDVTNAVKAAHGATGSGQP